MSLEDVQRVCRYNGVHHALGQHADAGKQLHDRAHLRDGVHHRIPPERVARVGVVVAPAALRRGDDGLRADSGRTATSQGWDGQRADVETYKCAHPSITCMCICACACACACACPCRFHVTSTASPPAGIEHGRRGLASRRPPGATDRPVRGRAHSLRGHGAGSLRSCGMGRYAPNSRGIHEDARTRHQQSSAVCSSHQEPLAVTSRHQQASAGISRHPQPSERVHREPRGAKTN